MPLYGYYGNADEQHHGTSAISAGAGSVKIPMGGTGTLTTQEADLLIAKGLDIRPVAGGTTSVRSTFNTFSFKR